MLRQSILVVDDEKNNVELLHEVLHHEYEVHKAYNANEALDILKAKNIDLIISDQRMPGTSGVELFSKVSKCCPRVGKVLLTGHHDDETLIDAVNVGSIDRYITKPFKSNSLMKIVVEVLNKREQRAVEERKNIESQLAFTAKMASLGDLVAGTAHELNNPLGFIHANLGNLDKFFRKILSLIETCDNADIPEKAKGIIDAKKEEIKYDYLKGRILEMIDRSRDGSERMKEIISDLKAFARQDALKAAEADINKSIDTTLHIIHNEHKNRIEISKQYGPLPLVTCYISKLNQVFLNLLVNACHSIEDKGKITIKTSTEAGNVIIKISDTGGGMSEEVREKIFEPFFTTKEEGKGTGLGLSISKGIIEKHKGTISLESTPGKGTTFTIQIPIKLIEEENEGTQ